MSDSRKKSIKARFSRGYTKDDFRRLFTIAEQSAFLKGGNNHNWQANFDWLIKDANMAKVLDGFYDRNQNKQPAGSNSVASDGRYDFDDLERKAFEKVKNMGGGNSG